jgi:hypothetical protein
MRIKKESVSSFGKDYWIYLKDSSGAPMLVNNNTGVILEVERSGEEKEE